MFCDPPVCNDIGMDQAPLQWTCLDDADEARQIQHLRPNVRSSVLCHALCSHEAMRNSGGAIDGRIMCHEDDGAAGSVPPQADLKHHCTHFTLQVLAMLDA